MSLSLHRRRFSGERCTTGVCGVYLLRDATSPRSECEFVFKPRSEELTNKPQGSKNRPLLKSGLKLGDAVLKERAAYLVDHDGFARVPECLLEEVAFDGEQRGEFGSLHQFVPHQCTSEDMGIAKFLVDDVHRIGLLDCRIFNLDRHQGNLLVYECQASHAGSLHLCPIDHGFSMPSWKTLCDAFFCWDWWSQASKPFSDATKEYVAKLEPIRDVSMLRQLGVDDESILTYVLCSLTVQQSVSAGLCLRDIAMIMQRQHEHSPSYLERVVSHSVQKTEFAQGDKALCGDKLWLSSVLEHFLIVFMKEMGIFIEGHEFSLKDQMWDGFTMKKQQPQHINSDEGDDGVSGD